MAKKVLPDSSAQETEEKVEQSRRGFWSALAATLLKQREASIVIVAIVLILYFQASSQVFLSLANIGTLSQYAAATTIIAAGEVMLLICGEMDLSAGMIFALAPFIMFFAYDAGLPLWIGVILGLIASGIVGLINGVITIFLKVPSFITTLGMLFLLEDTARRRNQCYSRP
jgi:simple sugar transport system permease protein